MPNNIHDIQIRGITYPIEDNRISAVPITIGQGGTGATIPEDALSNLLGTTPTIVADGVDYGNDKKVLIVPTDDEKDGSRAYGKSIISSDAFTAWGYDSHDDLYSRARFYKNRMFIQGYTTSETAPTILRVMDIDIQGSASTTTVGSGSIFLYNAQAALANGITPSEDGGIAGKYSIRLTAGPVDGSDATGRIWLADPYDEPGKYNQLTNGGMYVRSDLYTGATEYYYPISANKNGVDIKATAVIEGVTTAISRNKITNDGHIYQYGTQGQKRADFDYGDVKLYTNGETLTAKLASAFLPSSGGSLQLFDTAGSERMRLSPNSLNFIEGSSDLYRSFAIERNITGTSSTYNPIYINRFGVMISGETITDGVTSTCTKSSLTSSGAFVYSGPLGITGTISSAQYNNSFTLMRGSGSGSQPVAQLYANTTGSNLVLNNGGYTTVVRLSADNYGELKLNNANGVETARLTSGSALNSGGYLQMHNATGVAEVLLSAGSTGGELYLKDTNGVNRISEELTGISIRNSSNNAAVKMGVYNDNHGYVYLYDGTTTTLRSWLDYTGLKFAGTTGAQIAVYPATATNADTIVPTPYSSRCTMNEGAAYKVGPVVTLNVKITSAHAATNSPNMFGLPEGYRPGTDIALQCINITGSTNSVISSIPCRLTTAGGVYIKEVANGSVYAVSGSYIAMN